MKSINMATPEGEFASLQESPIQRSRFKNTWEKTAKLAITRHFMVKLGILGAIGGLVAIGYLKRKFLLDSAKQLTKKF